MQKLAEVRKQVKQPGKKLDMLASVYTGQLELPLRAYMDLIDVYTLWTDRPADLVKPEGNLSKAEKLAPCLRRMPGCHVVD